MTTHGKDNADELPREVNEEDAEDEMNYLVKLMKRTLKMEFWKFPEFRTDFTEILSEFLNFNFIVTIND